MSVGGSPHRNHKSPFVSSLKQPKRVSFDVEVEPFEEEPVIEIVFDRTKNATGKRVRLARKPICFDVSINNMPSPKTSPGNLIDLSPIKSPPKFHLQDDDDLIRFSPYQKKIRDADFF